MSLPSKKFWLVGLLVLVALPVIALKCLSLAAKKPERAKRPGKLTPCPDSPNCVCSEHESSSHGIQALTFDEDPKVAWSRLKEVLQELGGTEVRSSDSYLWFEFKTPLMGFVDDLECRLNSEKQQIEIRSASRVGHSDLGANRKRVEAVRAAFSTTRN